MKKKTNNKKGKQTNEVNNNKLKEETKKEKKNPLRGFSLRRYAVTRFTNNRFEVTKQQNMSRTRTLGYRSKSMLLPYHAMLKSKQTHARLGTLISLSLIERSSPITTTFELAQGFTHPVHINMCSEAQFKFGVHLGCKKAWPTGTSDYQ